MAAHHFAVYTGVFLAAVAEQHERQVGVGGQQVVDFVKLVRKMNGG